MYIAEDLSDLLGTEEEIGSVPCSVWCACMVPSLCPMDTQHLLVRGVAAAGETHTVSNRTPAKSFRIAFTTGGRVACSLFPVPSPSISRMEGARASPSSSFADGRRLCRGQSWKSWKLHRCDENRMTVAGLRHLPGEVRGLWELTSTYYSMAGPCFLARCGEIWLGVVERQQEPV